ncbi:MAG: deoxyribodipyrimidine photo-lyase [Desulfovibrionales bacterium]|nr:deoxyribodipyrimidine photo-lyase [Desulfovibrionales bacterium]
MNPRRCRILRDGPSGSGPILYWMHREFRASDNWGLTHARLLGLKSHQPVGVVFCLAESYLDATVRHFDFLFRGLEGTSRSIQNSGLRFFVLHGSPGLEVARLARQCGAGAIVMDFDPLRIKRKWVEDLLLSCQIPVHEVDSRNIVPCWITSERREFAARTIRPKIRRLLPEFLEEFPRLPAPRPWAESSTPPDFSRLLTSVKADTTVGPVAWITPGESAGQAVLKNFLSTRLPHYLLRNDPNQDVCSHLSAHLHFGMVSAQRILLELQEQSMQGEQVDSFVEELLVRRELADNFCAYTPDYDAESGFPVWARETLHAHRHDPRPVLHSSEELEHARTLDPLWNAAQTQMVRTGKMHGYLRMYWAKKILEWTPDVHEALRIAIRLNDRYSLDGRDSNGYTGIAWSMGGVHDRGWTERPVFGKIRYMNLQGARRKFDVDRFVRTWSACRKSDPTLPQDA